jgi:hypothetical protein
VNCLIDSNKSFIENPPVAGTEPGDHVEPVVSNEAAVEEQRHLEQEIRTQIADSYIPKKNAEAKVRKNHLNSHRGNFEEQ